MNVALCDECAPLLGNPKLDTLGKLAARVCLTCKARIASAALSTKTPLARKVAKVIDGAIAIGLAGASIAAAANTAAAVAESTIEQLDELVGAKKRRRRRRSGG